VPGLWGEAGGAEWEEWGVLGVQQLPDGVSVYVADGTGGVAAFFWGEGKRSIASMKLCTRASSVFW